ncbi:MAG: response regulator transcription factor [Azoarcus sp.]|jgi:DNA-binding NarL/FixJ family response regulator|nr:response regulator transcription factor [Azoarcus sp.]
MMRNLFLVADAISPSSRWQDAFADGVYFTLDVAISSRMKPDIVWLSTAVSEWGNLLANALQHFAGSPIVVVSNIPTEREAMRVMASGARGYCHAWASPEQFKEVAQVVSRGGYWIGQALMSRLIGIVNKTLPPLDELPKELSEREAEVARNVAEGQSNKEIARVLGITERTVKAHMGAIFAKLGVRDRLQLVLRLTGNKKQE